jgi:hypothetical protein
MSNIGKAKSFPLLRLVLFALAPCAGMDLSAAAQTGVTFRISDAALQRLYDFAEAKAASNVVQSGVCG